MSTKNSKSYLNTGKKTRVLILNNDPKKKPEIVVAITMTLNGMLKSGTGKRIRRGSPKSWMSLNSFFSFSGNSRKCFSDKFTFKIGLGTKIP